MLTPGRKFLGDLVYNRTYAKTLNDGSKESWADCVARNKEMHLRRHPRLRSHIDNAYLYVENKIVLPSMRSLQFGGDAIERSHARSYNCSFLHISEVRAFSELFWILMNGAGVGYSVQSHHVNRLPAIPEGTTGLRVIEDNKESWADSLTELFLNPKVMFDYSSIRPKDAPISTGGYASGPESLYETHEKIRKILYNAKGRKLRPIEVHDICCIIADVVVVGSVRRAALICLFDAWDSEMLYAKAGTWWEHSPWRGRANNSAVILRSDPQALFYYNQVMKACRESGAGEPGISWTNNKEMGFNPCHEIALFSKQFCNLTEINAEAVDSFQDFKDAYRAAHLLGCLQADLTDFPYLSDMWKKNSEREALLGISITGQATNWPSLEQWLPRFDSHYYHNLGDVHSQLVGINVPHRVNCVKPSGTASTLLGTTAGIHAAHDDYYIRRVRLEKVHPLAQYLQTKVGSYLEQDKGVEDNLVLSVPVKFEGAILRHEESAIDLFDRANFIADYWISPSHRIGDNKHNVSCTLSVKEDEWEGLYLKLWDDRAKYAGMSILPYDGGTYEQAPYESIDKETFERHNAWFPWERVKFEEVRYGGFKEDQKQELACGAGGCDLP